jgi:hypothetical protein
MEPGVEIFVPARVYARVGWATLAGSLLCVLAAFREPLTLIPALVFACAAAALFWLAARPPIRIGETQFNVGERAIAWREIREINRSRFVSPLVLRLRLTNSRQKVLIYPGEPEQVQRLLTELRRNSQLATFDGVTYRDYWTWCTLNAPQGHNPLLEQPVRMFSTEDEAEVERLYQKLKTVGRLDTRTPEASSGSDED